VQDGMAKDFYEIYEKKARGSKPRREGKEGVIASSKAKEKLQ
jgi:hypothetical protein